MCSAFAVLRLYGRGVFAAASSPITLGAVIQGFLSRNDVRLFAMPDFQGRLLNGSTEGKRQFPGEARLVPHIHRIETSRGKFAGLTT